MWGHNRTFGRADNPLSETSRRATSIDCPDRLIDRLRAADKSRMNEHSELSEDHPRGPSAVVMQRVIAAIVLGVAFLVLGSVFAPADSDAAPDQQDTGFIPHAPLDELDDHSESEMNTEYAPPAEALGDVTLTLIDPHAGLPVLGTLENARYRTVIFSTDAGPRYSVFGNGDSDLLGVLLDRSSLAARFPNLPMPDVAAGELTQLMYVDHNSLMPY